MVNTHYMVIMDKLRRNKTILMTLATGIENDYDCVVVI